MQSAVRDSANGTDVYRVPLDIDDAGVGATQTRVERIELTARRQTFTGGVALLQAELLFLEPRRAG